MTNTTLVPAFWIAAFMVKISFFLPFLQECFRIMFFQKLIRLECDLNSHVVRSSLYISSILPVKGSKNNTGYALCAHRVSLPHPPSSHTLDHQSTHVSPDSPDLYINTDSPHLCLDAPSQLHEDIIMLLHCR